MLVNIFDGVWHDGFVDINSGATVEKNDRWIYSVYSNLIRIKKNINYIYMVLIVTIFQQITELDYMICQALISVA